MMAGGSPSSNSSSAPSESGEGQGGERGEEGEGRTSKKGYVNQGKHRIMHGHGSQIIIAQIHDTCVH